MSFAAVISIVQDAAICCDENDGWSYETFWARRCKPIDIYPFFDTVNIII